MKGFAFYVILSSSPAILSSSLVVVNIIYSHWRFSRSLNSGPVELVDIYATCPEHSR
jgi:hypothetical protein